MDENFSFGYWLRRQRLARDLRQDELAARLGVATVTLRKLEADERRPSLQLIARVAEAFGLGDEEAERLRRVARADLSPAALPLPGAPAERAVGAPLASPAAPHVVTSARRSLPRSPTPFVGRGQELRDLLARLGQADARLVTLIAPGGMGKTRLALAAAARLQDDATFADGVAFAPLAPVAEPAGLDLALADALGLPLGAADRRPPRAQLLDFLREKSLLLVLDNCEHLREAVAELAGAILAEAPGVTLLATTRERLGLRGEHLLPLDGMRTELDGVELFALSARAVQPAFALTEAARPHVAAICARVGGMPLAIELAAGWADTLGLAEIAAELDRGDELLVSQAPDMPERHRSVRAVCDTTWARLSAEERAAFAQVAVFRGGGTRRALQAVTGASLAVLQALVGKALLRYDLERERYAIHELLRQYAAERLAADEAAPRGARERHAAYHLGALAAREAELKGAGQREALDAIGKDVENVRAAWWWAAEAGRLDLLAGAAGALTLAYEWLGRTDEGLEAMGRAVEAAEGSARAELLAVLLAARARFTFLRGNAADALALLAQAQAALDGASTGEAATDLARAQVLLETGACVLYQDYAVAYDAFTRSAQLYEAHGDEWGAATAMAGLGTAEMTLSSHYDEARRLLEQSAARFRALGDQIGLGAVLTELSVATRYLNRPAESLALAREAHALAHVSGNPRLVAQAASNLGAALYWSNINGEAYAVLRTALRIAQDLGHQADLPNICFRLGTATGSLGRYEEARAIFSSGLALARRVGADLDVCANLNSLGSIALAEGDNKEALRLADEALAHSTRLGEEFFRMGALHNRAIAARRLGDRASMRADTVAILRLLLTNRATLKWLLSAIALLVADSAAPERAPGVLALAEHSGLDQNVWDRDTGLDELNAIITALPPETRAAGEARWAGRDPWAALTELLAELEAEGWGGEDPGHTGA